MRIPEAWARRPGAGGNGKSILAHVCHEPADVYHARAGEYLTSHRLAAFRECPLLYHRQQTGEIEDEDRPAYLIGRAAHTLILEGREAFESQYVVGGPINPKTGQPYGANTKAWAEWAAAQNKAVLTDGQALLVEEMNEAVRANALASGLLAEGVAEGVARGDYHGVPCQIRLDWLHPERGIVDLKTCDNLTWFEAEARRFGYLHQASFYRAVLAQVAGQLVAVHLIAVEKREPFRCGVWLVGQDVPGTAQRENEEAIDRLKRCRQLDQWPTGYESLRQFDYL